jgi:hypothetical protein
MTTFHLPLRFRCEYPHSVFISETRLLSLSNIKRWTVAGSCNGDHELVLRLIRQCYFVHRKFWL